MESKRPSANTEVIGADGSFPREVQSAGAVPAWRAELSARVRQVKARRMMESELEAARRDQRGDMARQGQDGHPPASAPVGGLTATSLPSATAETPSPLDDLEAVDNPLVRGVLRRVRRAGEPSPLPMTFPPRRVSAATPDTVTVDSTPVAVPPLAAPVVDIGEIAGELDAALGDFELFLDQPAPSTPSPPETPPAVPTPSTPPPARARIVRRIRPLLRERVLAGLIDAGVLALSCLPLLCVAVVTGVTLTHLGVVALLGCAAALIAGMYLFSTVAVAGQTFGMMYLGLRVVSIYEDHELTPVQALLRAIGCGLSALLLGAGFLWVLIDRNQRGWHEYLSATQLVREWYAETLPDHQGADV